MAPVLLTHSHHFWLGGLGGGTSLLSDITRCSSWAVPAPALQSATPPRSSKGHGMLSLFSWPEKLAQSDGSARLGTATTAGVQAQPPLMCFPWSLRASEPEQNAAALLEGRGMATMTSLALSQYWALGPVLLSPIPDPSSNTAHGDSADQAPQCTLQCTHEARTLFLPLVYDCRRPGGSSGVLPLPVQARSSCYSWWLHRIPQSLNISGNEPFRDYLRKERESRVSQNLHCHLQEGPRRHRMEACRMGVRALDDVPEEERSAPASSPRLLIAQGTILCGKAQILMTLC